MTAPANRAGTNPVNLLASVGAVSNITHTQFNSAPAPQPAITAAASLREPTTPTQPLSLLAAAAAEAAPLLDTATTHLSHAQAAANPLLNRAQNALTALSAADLAQLNQAIAIETTSTATKGNACFIDYHVGNSRFFVCTPVAVPTAPGSWSNLSYSAQDYMRVGHQGHDILSPTTRKPLTMFYFGQTHAETGRPDGVGVLVVKDKHQQTSAKAKMLDVILTKNGTPLASLELEEVGNQLRVRNIKEVTPGTTKHFYLGGPNDQLPIIPTALATTIATPQIKTEEGQLVASSANQHAYATTVNTALRANAKSASAAAQARAAAHTPTSSEKGRKISAWATDVANAWQQQAEPLASSPAPSSSTDDARRRASADDNAPSAKRPPLPPRQ